MDLASNALELLVVVGLNEIVALGLKLANLRFDTGLVYSDNVMVLVNLDAQRSTERLEEVVFV